MGRRWHWVKAWLHKRAADAVLRQQIYGITQVYPRNLRVYALALQHGVATDPTATNERLEFLGDAVLSLVIGAYLFQKYPLKGEGFLTEIRSRLVNRQALNTLARRLRLERYVHVVGSRSSDVYGNALEALIGAVYVDRGYARCARFIIEQLVRGYFDLHTVVHTDRNYKSKLLMWTQKAGKEVVFRIVDAAQVQQGREFTAAVYVDGQVMGQGQGGNKKVAEQKAAEQALQALGLATSTA